MADELHHQIAGVTARAFHDDAADTVAGDPVEVRAMQRMLDFMPLVFYPVAQPTQLVPTTRRLLVRTQP